jgi:hypothetical protein
VVPLLLRFIRLRGRGMMLAADSLDDWIGVLTPEVFCLGISMTSFLSVVTAPSVYRPCLSRTLSFLTSFSTPSPSSSAGGTDTIGAGIRLGGAVTTTTSDPTADIRLPVALRDPSRRVRGVSELVRRSPSKRSGVLRVRSSVVMAVSLFAGTRQGRSCRPPPSLFRGLPRTFQPPKRSQIPPTKSQHRSP